jgi:hypothetical protein
MNNYFYQLDTPILKEEEKDELVELTLLHKNNFKAYASMKTGTIDGNQSWRYYNLFGKSFITRLTENCNLSCIPLFIRHQPGVEVIRHIDDPNNRNTVLSIPLTPKVGYPPTYFFASREETDPVEIASFPNLNACLLNTQKLHSLVNTATTLRINFQLCFNEPFDQVRKMIINKTLFNVPLE